MTTCRLDLNCRTTSYKEAGNPTNLIQRSATIPPQVHHQPIDFFLLQPFEKLLKVHRDANISIVGIKIEGWE